MDNQHRKIDGYRELDQDTIDLINKVKLHGLVLQELISEVQLHIAAQRAAGRLAVDFEAEMARLNLAQPERWTALARTHFQEGSMALVRAITQPTGF